MALIDTILQITKQLYPTGRAFSIPINGAWEKLHAGLGASEVRAYNDAVAILNSILPDNDNFTTDDATDWERRLGLITNSAVSLSDRKLAIERKMNHPGTIKARQNYLYVQGQLQAAGFNVYVYETGSGASPVPFQLGQRQLGQFQLGGKFIPMIVNYIDEDMDSTFNVGANTRSVFYIGGNPNGTYANVNVDRKDEFRQLVLKLKPTQTVAFILINFV